MTIIEEAALMRLRVELYGAAQLLKGAALEEFKTLVREIAMVLDLDDQSQRVVAATSDAQSTKCLVRTLPINRTEAPEIARHPSRNRVPRHVGDIVYHLKDATKLVCLVALHRSDTDRLDWFEAGSEPFFAADDAPSRLEKSPPG